MKKFLFILLMWGNVALAQSPIITQTYTDRCTGQTFVFSVPSNGQTVVVFYNKSRAFTANEFTNGAIIGSAYIKALSKGEDVGVITKEFLNEVLGN
jgi:hypothetical protein